MNHQPQTIDQPVSTPPPADEKISARLRNFQVADHERRGSGGRGKRRLLWLFVLAVLVAAGVGGYSYRNANSAPEVDVFVYTGKPAKDVLLDLSGFVVPRTKVVISPQ